MSEQYVRNLAELKNLCLEFNLLCVRAIEDKWYIIRSMQVLLSVSDISLSFERWEVIEKRVMGYVMTELFNNGPK
jgi:hypothetical protein